MSSFNDCIKFSLNIKDKNIIFQDNYYKLKDNKKYKVFEAVLIQTACPYCGSVDLIHNGHLKTDIRYITANASSPVIVRLLKQRVLCRDCNKRSMAKTDLVNKYCSISNASKQKVLTALTEDRSMTSIAREHNVSINTVQRVLSFCSHKFIDGYDYLPEHLAFDEFKGVDRQLHFICLDGESHEVVQILRTRFKRTLLKYFGKFTPKARNNVKTVSMDLNFYYQEIVSACFPNAKIVIDRFHMIQMLTRSLNSLRVQIMKQFKKYTRTYQLLKAPWKLYLKKYKDLDKVHPYYNWHYRDSLTQEQVVNEGLDADPILRSSYELMQEFMTALENKDVKILKELIYSKEPVGYLMHKTLMTFRKNCSGILNRAIFSYSNGYLERFYRKIK